MTQVTPAHHNPLEHKRVQALQAHHKLYYQSAATMNVESGVKLSLLIVELPGNIIGNSLLFLFILKSRQLNQTASLNFIFNCGMADLLNGLLNIPLGIAQFVFKADDLKGPISVYANIFIKMFTIFLTLSSVMLLLIDRILIVKYPVKYLNKMTTRKARVGITITWVVSLAVAAIVTVAKFLQRPPLSPEEDVFTYTAARSQQEIMADTVVSSTLVIVIAVPSVVLYREIKKRQKNETQRTQVGERMITKSCTTTLIVMALYLVSYLPFVILNTLSLFYITSETTLSYSFIAFQLSSCVNPYLLFFRSSIIRENAVKILPEKLAEKLEERDENAQQEQN